MTSRRPAAAGAGGGGPDASVFHDKMQETALEALAGKESCVAKGYYADHFLRLLRPPAAAVRRPPPTSPLIRRGYFTRVSALEHIVAAFLERVAGACLPRANLVLLGAGLDTLCFRLLEAGRQVSSPTATDGTTPATRAVAAATAEAGLALSCFEVDLAPVALYKASCLRASTELLSAVGGEEVEETGKETQEAEGGAPMGLEAAATVVFRGAGGYALIAGDLSDIAGLEAALDAARLDWTAPTLLVAECVLVYMPADASHRLLRWAASRFGPPHSPGAALVSYDMILPNDAFGRVMRTNLKARGLELPGFEAWGQSLCTQLRRFVDLDDGEGVEGPETESAAGQRGQRRGRCWERAVGGDMNAVYQHLLAPADRERAQRLETLDEVEEWRMLMGHYCYVTATRGAALLGSLLRDVEGFQECQGT